MLNKEKICPVIPGFTPSLEKATRFRLTAFSISSIDSSTIIAFFLDNAPYSPIQNRMAARVR
jgi:hypothetical protein